MRPAAHLHLGELTLTAAEEWAPDGNRWCFVRVHEGTGYWLGNSGSLELAEGCLLVLSPFRKGTFRTSRLGSARLYSFQLDQNCINGLLTVPERRFLDESARQPGNEARSIPPDHVAARLFAEACPVLANQNSLKARAWLLRIAAHCFDWNGVPDPFEPSGFISALKRFHQVMSQFTAGELCRISTRTLAELCGCSAPHFNRLFQQEYGMSFRAKRRQMRLAFASEMLARPDSDIPAIASAAGFRGVREFQSEFQNATGLSPAEFQRTKNRDSAAERNAKT